MIRILQYRPGTWLRSGGQLLAWMLVRAAAQAATLLLLARILGVSDYGRLVVIISLSVLVAPLVGLGLGNILLRNGARDPVGLPLYFSIAIRWWWWTLLPGFVVSFLLFMWFLPGGLPLIAGLAAIGAEVAVTSLVEVRGRHCQAARRIGAFGAINAGLPLLRLLMLVMLFLLMPGVRLEAVLWVYTVSSVIYLLLLLPPMRGLSNWRKSSEQMSASSGLPFLVAIAATRLQTEFNKPVLAHSAFSMAGAYNVAQRFVDLASMPLMALQEALWPRLYAHANPVQALLRTGGWLLLLGLVCSGVLWLSAPVLPWLLGADYTSAADALQMLAWLPMLQTFRSLLNFHAIHFGRMGWIGWAYACGAVVGVLAVVGLVPIHGLTGAVAASYASEFTMIILLATGMKLARV